MKPVLLTIFAPALLGGLLLAQQTPQSSGSMPQQRPSSGQGSPAAASGQAGASAAQNPTTTRIAPGSVIPAQLAKTVEAKKVKKGDPVIAKVTQDLRSNSGELIVPKDTKVIGHVTEAQPRSKEQKESQVGIAFNELSLKNGEQMQLPMSIQAIIAPPNRNPGNPGGYGEAPSSSPGPETSGPMSGPGARGGMGGNYPAPEGPGQTGGTSPRGAQTPANPNPPITGNTKGVVGIPHLELAAASDTAMGSVVTSDKSNVKLEDGTLLLLKVSPGPAQTLPTPPSPQK